MLNNPCATCPATPQNHSPSPKDTNPAIAAIITVLPMSNTMGTRWMAASALKSSLD